MQVIQPGVGNNVSFDELNAALQSSILGPAGARSVAQADLEATLAASILGPSGARVVGADDIAWTVRDTKNSGGAVNVTTNTVIISDTPTLTVGDIILVFAACNITAPGTAGDIDMRLSWVSGTGTISLNPGNNIIQRQTNVPISNFTGFVLNAIAHCTASGTVTFRLGGNCLGGTGTVSTNDAQMRLLRIAA